jgi:hypothetical protein
MGMKHYQKRFTVMGYSFLSDDQIAAILDDIMAMDWCSQWLTQKKLTITSEIRTALTHNWGGTATSPELDGFMPMKREIPFMLHMDMAIVPEVVRQISHAFSEAFDTRMKAILHGKAPSPFVSVLADSRKDDKPIEWERYPIKAYMTGRRLKEANSTR